MGQRLLQRPSNGCLYKGNASSARRHSRSPSTAHRATPPSPAVTGRRRGRAAYNAPPRRSTCYEFQCLFTRTEDLGYWVASPSRHRARSAALQARRVAAARSAPRTRRVRPRKARLFSSSPVARSRPRRIRSRSTSRARLYIEPLSKCNQIAKTTPTAAEAVCTAPFPLR